MTNLQGKEIQIAKETEIARMFIAQEKPNKTLSLKKLQEVAESKGYYFNLNSLKIALSN